MWIDSSQRLLCGFLLLLALTVPSHAVSAVMRSAATVDDHGRLLRTDVVSSEPQKKEQPATLTHAQPATDGSSASQMRTDIKSTCGSPLLLSGRSMDLVISFWTNQPDSTSAAFLKGTSKQYYANLVFALRSAERHGLLQHVRTVHILMDDAVLARDGPPRSFLFNHHATADTPEMKLVSDGQIGVHFHQHSAKLSALAKIPNVADWIFYMPDDVLLTSDFSMEDFWDKEAQKPKMYAYDQSSVGWCDGGSPVGSFHGPVLVNRCFLEQVGKKYSDKSYSPHTWAQNQLRNMGEDNIDSICLYTKAVLTEGIAVNGGVPAWHRKCLMGSDAGSEHCTADELLGIPLQAPGYKFVKVADAKAGEAVKDLSISQGTESEQQQVCDELQTRSFFRSVAGSAPMALEATVPAASNTTGPSEESWPLLCFENPALAKIIGSDGGSNACAVVMIVVLSMSLLIMIWIQRSRFENSSTKELLATGCVFGYMGLTIIVDILIRKFHQEGLESAFKFHPAVMVLLIEIGKLALSGTASLVDWQHTRESSMGDFAQTMKLMMIPSVCYVFLNIGRYMALSGADLDTYRVWRCTDIGFVVVIWYAMFRKKPTVNQLCGLALVFCACAGMHVQDMKNTTSMWPVLIITGLAFVSSLGLVTNEFGLKASANLSIFVQNVALYLVTSTMNGAYVWATVPKAEILQGIGYPQLLLIFLDVLLGLCVAVVLKYANAMVKQLGSGWLAPLEPLVAHFVVGTKVTPVMVMATILAGAGSIIYRLEPAPPKQEKSDFKNGSNDKLIVLSK